MSRWKVTRMRCTGGWLAQERGARSGWEFPTWREALAYADRMARTVEVVLPPTAHLTTSTLRTRPSDDGVLVKWKAGPRWEAMRTTKEELRPLALALLAHAEQEEHE